MAKSASNFSSSLDLGELLCSRRRHQLQGTLSAGGIGDPTVPRIQGSLSVLSVAIPKAKIEALYRSLIKRYSCMPANFTELVFCLSRPRL